MIITYPMISVSHWMIVLYPFHMCIIYIYIYIVDYDDDDYDDDDE